MARRYSLGAGEWLTDLRSLASSHCLLSEFQANEVDHTWGVNPHMHVCVQRHAHPLLHTNMYTHIHAHRKEEKKEIRKEGSSEAGVHGSLYHSEDGGRKPHAMASNAKIPRQHQRPRECRHVLTHVRRNYHASLEPGILPRTEDHSLVLQGSLHGTLWVPETCPGGGCTSISYNQSSDFRGHLDSWIPIPDLLGIFGLLLPGWGKVSEDPVSAQSGWPCQFQLYLSSTYSWHSVASSLISLPLTISLLPENFFFFNPFNITGVSWPEL